MQRCVLDTEGHPHYKDVHLDPSWKDFKSFLRDVGEAPSEKHTIGRIRNDLGYFKENVRWETMHQQTRNKSNNIWVDGVILKDWCLDRGFRYKTVWQWRKNGMSYPEIEEKGKEVWGKGQIT